MSNREVSESLAFEVMMKEAPCSNKFDSGYDGILTECRSCRLHRPYWIYETCVFEYYPYCVQGSNTI